MKIKFEASYDGHVVRGDKSVTMRLKVPFMQVSEALKSVLMIGTSATVGLISEHGEKHRLGLVNIERISLDRDGEMKLAFLSDVESVDLALLSSFSGKPVTVLLSSKVVSDV